MHVSWVVVCCFSFFLPTMTAPPLDIYTAMWHTYTVHLNAWCWLCCTNGGGGIERMVLHSPRTKCCAQMFSALSIDVIVRLTAPSRPDMKTIRSAFACFRSSSQFPLKNKRKRNFVIYCASVACFFSAVLVSNDSSRLPPPPFP